MAQPSAVASPSVDHLKDIENEDDVNNNETEYGARSNFETDEETGVEKEVKEEIVAVPSSGDVKGENVGASSSVGIEPVKACQVKLEQEEELIAGNFKRLERSDPPRRAILAAPVAPCD